MFYRLEPKVVRQKGNISWNIPAMQYGPTSTVYGVGKKLSISKICSDSHFKDQAKVFMCQVVLLKMTSHVQIKKQ